MTVRDLIRRLEDYDDSLQVQVVHQSSWPLREVVRGVWQQEELAYANDDADDEDKADSPNSDYQDVVFIVADGHPYEGTPYGPRAAFEACA